MAELLKECELMEDDQVERTIRRRLTEGLLFAIVMGPRELVWRPIHRDAYTLSVELPGAAAEELDRYAEIFGYGRDVLAATVLSNAICKPMEVVAREHRRYARSPMADPTQVRREPGKGNIYPVQFAMPGYQLVFIRMLADHLVDKTVIIEEALVALARQVIRGDNVAGAPVTQEAYSFARRMVSLAAPSMVAGQPKRASAW